MTNNTKPDKAEQPPLRVTVACQLSSLEQHSNIILNTQTPTAETETSTAANTLMSPEEVTLQRVQAEAVLRKRIPRSLNLPSPPLPFQDWMVEYIEAAAPVTVSTEMSRVDSPVERPALHQNVENDYELPGRELPPVVPSSQSPDMNTGNEEATTEVTRLHANTRTKETSKPQPAKTRNTLNEIPNTTPSSPKDSCKSVTLPPRKSHQRVLRKCSRSQRDNTDLKARADQDLAKNPTLPPRTISGVQCTHPELLALPLPWECKVDAKTLRIFYSNRCSGERTYTHPVLGRLPQDWIFQVDKIKAGEDESESGSGCIRTVYLHRGEGMSWAGDPRDPLEMAAFNAAVLKREYRRGKVGGIGVGELEGEDEDRDRDMDGKQHDRNENNESIDDLKREVERERQLVVKFGELVKATSIGGTITLLGVK